VVVRTDDARDEYPTQAIERAFLREKDALRFVKEKEDAVARVARFNNEVLRLTEEWRREHPFKYEVGLAGDEMEAKKEREEHDKKWVAYLAEEELAIDPLLKAFDGRLHSLLDPPTPFRTATFPCDRRYSIEQVDLET
jgi:hypothetical protein